MDSTDTWNYFTYFITTFMILLFSYLFYKTSIGSNQTKKIKKEGVKATAIITGIKSQSGKNSAFINVELTVKFTTHVNVNITTNTQTAISSVDIPKFQPGESLAIKYLKENPQKIVADIPHPLSRDKAK
ncbi:hypothetical protein Z042_15545 [Chania multitudinisentens RB-25]|uniref:DUF3592 domain-containing protein n=1 Tax=Chania multitudinisentens RB-25 TaxID=1441930 RepID=W0LLF1_9GAMM|nr:DUF3592 domain-containing protein [Chania multitudinisentens]AHG22850.1 hypothetical protein Z042_15545 [Chania multitudinisentens RB-25]